MKILISPPFPRDTHTPFDILLYTLGRIEMTSFIVHTRGHSELENALEACCCSATTPGSDLRNMPSKIQLQQNNNNNIIAIECGTGNTRKLIRVPVRLTSTAEDNNVMECMETNIATKNPSRRREEHGGSGRRRGGRGQSGRSSYISATYHMFKTHDVCGTIHELSSSSSPSPSSPSPSSSSSQQQRRLYENSIVDMVCRGEFDFGQNVVDADGRKELDRELDIALDISPEARDETPSPADKEQYLDDYLASSTTTRDFCTTRT